MRGMWLGDKDEFYVYSAEDDPVINAERLDEIFNSRAGALQHVQEYNRRSPGYEVREIQIFKVNLKYVGSEKVPGGRGE